MAERKIENNPMIKSLENIAEKAKVASRSMALVSARVKRSALEAAASALDRNVGKIIEANARDLAGARKKKLPSALIDRLALNPGRVAAMVEAVREIAALADPVGEIVEEWKNRDGFKIQKVRVPLGVIAMVYESRPNVTVESAALCLKAGNSVILRGGSEAIHSNTVLAGIVSNAVTGAGVPAGAVAMITDTDRKNIYELGRMERRIDLLIARGSESMVTEIRKRSTVPVLGHGKGVCHVYVDRNADLGMASEIAYNAKVQRPGVCNAMETLIVHKDVAKRFLPELGLRYVKAGVLLKGDAAARASLPGARKATEKDWPTEYLDLVLSVKVVDSLDQALDHINRYGSGHTDAIVTEDRNAAQKFLRGVDSAAVFHNISTRLHDGAVFGLGAEIGISTQKLHARGTMGIRELTTTKYVALGSGQIRK